MSTAYYYLVASLPELLSSADHQKHPFPAFDGFCREELTVGDYGQMRRCFLLNDVRNISLIIRQVFGTGQLLAQAAGRFLENETPSVPLTFPGFYDRENLLAAFEDPELFLAQISSFLWDLNSSGRSPENPLENELLYRLFSDMNRTDQSTPDGNSPPAVGFVRDYLIFEMHLRNLVTALSLRAQDEEYSHRIVAFDHFSWMIAHNPAPDFGLGGDLGGMSRLMDLHGSVSTLEIENAVSEVRWAWLDDQVSYRSFSREAVFAYALKLADIERWLTLVPELGRRKLDDILESLTTEITTTNREDFSS